MERFPDISVILPVYNAEQYLEDSINSLQHQSVDDFELIVINDGSTDNTAAVIHQLQKEDPRIKGLTNRTNIGIARSLNRGLKRAKGRYIARQDADDISLPRRFEKQKGFLDGHQDVGVVGSAMTIIDGLGNQIRLYRQPETDMQIRFRLLFNCPFVHTSVMMRRSVIQQNSLFYDTGYSHAEDYQFWTRFLRVSTGYNFQTPLVKYRLTRGGVSSANPAKQADNAERISLSQLAFLDGGLQLSIKEKAVMLELYRRYLVKPCPELSRHERRVVPALYKLLTRFMEKHQCRDNVLSAFRDFLSENLKTVNSSGLSTIVTCMESAVLNSPVTGKLKLKFPNAMDRLRYLIWRLNLKKDPRVDR